MNHTSKRPKAGIITGLVLIAAWYATTHTTLILAWRAGSLSQTQALCDGPFGRWARAISATGAARSCNQVDSLSMWVNAAGFAGLLLLAASAAVLLYRAQHRPTQAPAA